MSTQSFSSTISEDLHHLGSPLLGDVVYLARLLLVANQGKSKGKKTEDCIFSTLWLYTLKTYPMKTIGLLGK